MSEDSAKVDSAVGRWLQRPYVGDRFTDLGPRMTNAGVTIVTVLIQTAAIGVWYFSPVEFPLRFAFLPVWLIAFQTVVLLLAEPAEQRRGVA